MEKSFQERNTSCSILAASSIYILLFYSILFSAPGDLIWKYKTSNGVKSSPCVSDGVVFVGSYDYYLYAIETYGYKGFNDNKSASYIPSKTFSVSPNPFSNRLSLSLPSSGVVYSLTGQLIMKLDKGKHSIGTSKWKQGVYIVKSGKECKRIVKVR
ncbi:MAG: PQQ-binding-like beta-propeller repeat protein [Candidatus Coatesbacteria bacterium]|nr:PQQ-binding-like beta-propeller repeat protein [Candidatus Coatesbacteria bacterium]